MANEIRTAEDWRARAEENLRIAAKEPHKLGWVLGFTKLTPVHSQWIKYVWESNEPRALQAFRGGYKTTSIVVVGCIRWLLFHPNDRILLMRKSFTAAAEAIRAIAQAMRTRQARELFRQAHGRYPKPKVDRAGNLSFDFKTTITPEGNITGAGIDQGITGLHFDKVIADDIITLRDRVSRAERERTIEMIREIAANIVDPNKGSIWTGTPWHREDGWKTINRFCDIAKYPISRYNFIGEEAAERKRLMTTPYLYAANYELELGKDESLIFSEPRYPVKWDYSITGAAAQLDAAFHGDHYCALTIAAPKGGGFYQAIGFVYAGHIRDWEGEASRLCKKYRVKYLYVETNADKGASAERLSSRGVLVKPYAENMNKHIKISAYLYEVWNNLEWAEETDEEYMTQLTEYKEGVLPDDAPDSAASLFREAFLKTKAASLERWKW
jgi:hypothetical protein